MHDEAAPPPEFDALPTSGWQPLPRRARALMILNVALPLLVVVPAATIVATATDVVSPWLVAPIALVLALAVGAWRGARAYACFAWAVDEHGLAVRRGAIWRRETRVPASRVQHLDLRRGPLQRSRQLATLVAHTAGTRLSTVTVPNMDFAEAERLRDLLSRQIRDVDD